MKMKIPKTIKRETAHAILFGVVSAACINIGYMTHKMSEARLAVSEAKQALREQESKPTPKELVEAMLDSDFDLQTGIESHTYEAQESLIRPALNGTIEKECTRLEVSDLVMEYCHKAGKGPAEMPDTLKIKLDGKEITDVGLEGISYKRHTFLDLPGKMMTGLKLDGEYTMNSRYDRFHGRSLNNMAHLFSDKRFTREDVVNANKEYTKQRRQIMAYIQQNGRR